MDVGGLNNYFLTRPLLNGAGEFAVFRTNNVPEFSFATVSDSEICHAVMSIRSDAAGVDGIPLLFINLLLPVVLPVLTHNFNHIFVSSEFPGKWKTSVVLPILKVSSPAKFFDYRPCLFVEGFWGGDGSANGETYYLQQLAVCLSIWIPSTS
jgi:hypothetical protein